MAAVAGSVRRSLEMSRAAPASSNPWKNQDSEKIENRAPREISGDKYDGGVLERINGGAGSNYVALFP